MRNKMLRKISVLLLSLTMVMTSMNLSFALGGEISEPANSQVSEQVGQEGAEQQTEEAVTPVPNQETSGEEVVQKEENSDKATDETSDRLEVSKAGIKEESAAPTEDSLTIYTINGKAKNMLIRVSSVYTETTGIFFYSTESGKTRKSDVSSHPINNNETAIDEGTYYVYEQKGTGVLYKNSVEQRGTLNIVASAGKDSQLGINDSVTLSNKTALYNDLIANPNSVSLDDISIQYMSKKDTWDDIDNDSTSSSRHLFGKNSIETVKLIFAGNVDYAPTEITKEISVSAPGFSLSGCNVVVFDALALSTDKATAKAKIESTIKNALTTTVPKDNVSITFLSNSIAGNNGYVEIGERKDVWIGTTIEGHTFGCGTGGDKVAVNAEETIKATYSSDLPIMEKETTATATIIAKPITSDDVEIKVVNPLASDEPVSPTVTAKDTTRNVDLSNDDFEVTVTPQKEPKKDGNYSLTVTGKGYYSGTTDFDWNVIDFKASLSATKFVYDNTEKNVTLTVTDGSGNPLTKGEHYEITRESKLSGTEEGTYKVVINGIGDYESVKNIELEWNIVQPIALKDSFIVLDGKTSGQDGYGVYDYNNGQDITPTVTVVDSNGNKLSSKNGDFEFDSSSVSTAKNTGKYNIKINAGKNGFYTGSAEIEWTIKGTSISEYIIVCDDVKFDGSDSYDIPKENVHVYEGWFIDYYGELQSDDFEIVAEKTETATGIKNGYKITVKGCGKYDGEKEGTWNLVKGTPTFTINPKEDVVYNGSPQDLVDSETNGGTFGYWIVPESWVKQRTLVTRTELTNTFTKETEAKATNAGTYYVYYQIDGDDEWKTIDVQSSILEPLRHVIVTVNSKPIVNETEKYEIKVSNKAHTGESVSPTVSVYDKERSEYLVAGTDYELSGDTEGTDVGTYTIKINGIGNYKDSVDVDWHIVAFLPELSDDEFTYDGTEHTVILTVKGDGDVVLDEGIDYEVDRASSVFTATDAGTYTVKVTGIGAYTDAGEVDVNWTINPAKLLNADLKLSKTGRTILGEYFYDGTDKSVELAVKHRLQAAGTYPTLQEGVDYEVVAEKSTFTATDAGTYTVTIKGKEGSNYTGEASATWEIQGIPMDWIRVTLDQNSFTYDGTEKTPKVQVGLLSPIGINILKEGEDYEILGEEDGSITSATNVNRDEDGNVGYYTIKVKGKKYFKDIHEVKWQINPAELDKDWVLAGIPLNPADPVEKLDGKNYLHTGLETGPERSAIGTDSKIYVNKKGQYTLQESDFLKDGTDYHIDEEHSTLKAKDEGSYNVTVVGDGNYAGTVICNWSIGSAALCYINGSLIPSTTYTTEYDGTVVEPSIELRTLLGKTINPSSYEMTGDLSAKDAGTYTINIKGNGGDDFYGTMEITWTITPRLVISSWENTKVVYNGKVQRPELKFYHLGLGGATDILDTLKGLSFKDLWTGEYKDIIDTRGIVDDYDATAKAISLTRPKNADTYAMYARLTGDINPNNYTFLDVDLIKLGNERIWYTSFEITQRPVSVDWSNLEFTYDGRSHVPTATPTKAKAGDEDDGTGLIENDICRLKVEGEQVNVGTYEATVTDILFDSQLFGDNYKLTENNDELMTEFNILGRSISEAHFNAVDTVYSGTVKNPSVTGYDVLGILDVRTLKYDKDYTYKVYENYSTDQQKDVTDTVTDAGTYTIEITGKGNYSGTTTVEWTIEKARPSYDIDAIDNLVYNANDQALVTGKTSDGTIEYCVKDSIIGALSGLGPWVAEDKATAKNAGTYYVYYKVTGDRNHYDVGADLLHVRVVTIDKADLTADMISLNPATFEYDGDAKTSVVSVEFKDGTVVPTSDYHIYSWSDTTATDAGNYNIYITSDIAASGNFKDKGLVITKKWEILADEVTLSLDKESYESTYGSEAPEVKVNVSDVNKKQPKVNLLYKGTSKGGNYYVGATAPIEAGEYTVTAYIDDKNFSAEEVTAPYIVNQKAIEITWDKTPLVYNGLKQVPNCSIPEGKIEKGDTVTVSASVKGWHAAAGEYTATAALSGRGSSNYLITNSTEDYTIAKKPVTVTWGKSTFVYNGKEQAPRIANVKGLLPLESFLRLVSVDTVVDGEHKNVGNYTIQAILKGYTSGNYEIIEGAEKSFKISKRPVTITINDKEKIYGESDPKLTWEDKDHQIVRRDRLGIKLVREPGKNIGEYNIFNVKRLNKNYSVKFVNDEGEKAFAVLKINKRPIEFNWTLDKKNINKITYDGKSHRAEATVGEMGFAYNDAELTDVLYANELKTEVGKYTAKAFLKMKDAEETVEPVEEEEPVMLLAAPNEESDEGEIVNTDNERFNLVENYEVSNDTFDYEIEPVKNVPTGDQNNILPYALFGGLALAAMIAMLANRRRKEN